MIDPALLAEIVAGSFLAGMFCGFLLWERLWTERSYRSSDEPSGEGKHP